MIIEGTQRGGAKDLADHLLRRDTNEDVIVRELHNFPMQNLNDATLRRAVMQMEAQGLAKGKQKMLYHAFMSLQEGETLKGERLKHAIDTYAKNMGMENHQRIVVEHHKDGRQHFHIVFNIIRPDKGIQAGLNFTRRVEWRTSRQLEQELGLKPVVPKGRQSRQWEHQRGKRTGIDPRQVRKDVTAIYRASKTGKEFIGKLRDGGYILTKGRNGSYVIVDKQGDIHGLMRRIEGARLKDLRQRFPDLKNQPLPRLADVLKEHRPKAARPSKRAKQQDGRFSPGPKRAKPAMRGSASFAKAALSAILAPNPAAAAAPARYQAKSLYRPAARAAAEKREPSPVRPMQHKGGWPEAAIKDWESWGRRAPRRFFAKWPELSAS